MRIFARREHMAKIVHRNVVASTALLATPKLVNAFVQSAGKDTVVIDLVTRAPSEKIAKINVIA